MLVKILKILQLQPLYREELKFSTVVGNNKPITNIPCSNSGLLVQSCRASIPSMKKQYAKYSDEGFEIFAVSLDVKRSDWIKASKEEDIPWIDMRADISGKGPAAGFKATAARKYAVWGIPANFLVNQEGIIVAINLRGSELKNKLKELF